MRTSELVDMITKNLPRPDCYKTLHPDDWRDSVWTMVQDLKKLAGMDGCIAAAWSLSMLEKMAAVEESR